MPTSTSQFTLAGPSPTLPTEIAGCGDVLFDHIPDPLLLIDCLGEGNFTVTAANRAARELFQGEKNADREVPIIGRPIEAVLPEEVVESARACYRNGKVVGGPLRTEFADPRGIGSFDLAVTAICGTDGPVTHLIISAHDVTEARRREAELQRVQANLSTLLNQTPDFMWLLRCEANDAFIVEAVNPAGLAIVHRVYEKARGMSIIGADLRDFAPKVLIDHVLADYRDCVATGQFVRHEFVAPENQLVMDRITVPSIGENGRITQLSISIRNVTEARRREAELGSALRENEKIMQQLHDTQNELVAAARQAGMAEIANNVLHNVGNVLNGVNVSADLVTRKIRESKVQGLAKAVQLINDHAADLGDFFTRDERGKILPGYLNKLGVALAAEQQGILEELASLTKSIDHIKDIVATQQSYAGAANFVEPIHVRDLIEDALRMKAGALARSRIEIVKEFAETPVIALDKSRMLQILINLVSNATQAMEAMPDRPHRLTLVTDIADSSDRPRVRICVTDNGDGIAPENMERLFVHGFTTRPEGHGFGLHSCVLAAAEMGGTLTARSDGQGKGASFTLEFPIGTGCHP